MAISLTPSHPKQLLAGLVLNRLLKLPLCIHCDQRVVVTMSGTDPLCDDCAGPS
jgi:hypothetical protein